MREWKLAETNYGAIKGKTFEVAVLPLGATEPHNLHLPYGTDIFEADLIGERICEAAHARGAKVILLPTIPYGTETNQMAFPLAMNLNPSTLFLVIKDLVDSIAHHGMRKIVLLNSHGGNDLKPILRELYGKSQASLFLCNWYTVLADMQQEIFEHRDDHAGEVETSLALAFFPELVAKQPDGTLSADDGATKPTRFEAVNRGWISITRPWHLLTTNSGAGNPHAASAEKGQRLLLDAFKSLTDLHKDGWELHFAGSIGPDRHSANFAKTIVQSARGFPVFVHFNVARDEIRDLYSRASIYWHATGFGFDPDQFPSKHEHFGISTVEAMSAGAVPVVYASGGQKEIVTNGVDGFWWHDLTELAEQTGQLVADPDLRRRLAQQAVLSSKRFGETAFVAKIDELLTRSTP